MLLTLAVNSLRARLVPKKVRSGPADAIVITDLPRITRETLGLYGLHLSTPVLAGADAARLDVIRDAADKAQCPCLTLTEADPQPLFTENDAVGDAAIDRLQRVVRAASRLGCSSIGLSISGDGNEDTLEYCIERLRRVLTVAERLEVNLLVQPMAGFTADPDRLTDLIKRVGGFRVGTFPDFITASHQPDPTQYLKRIVPYAAAINASCSTFKPTKKPGSPLGAVTHDAFDLTDYLKTVASVGYTGTLAIDYRGDAPDALEAIAEAKDIFEAIVRPPSPLDDIEALVDEALDAEGELIVDDDEDDAATP
jgi:sugar phosphate isomerase/epimerase